MMIDKEKFSAISDAVKLSFTEEEEAKLITDLNQMLEMIEAMKEMDTEKVEPMTYVHSLKNVLRKDSVTNTESEDELFAGVPEMKDRYYVVPQIME